MMIKKDVYYEATALINYTDSYGISVIKKGDKCIIKKPNLNVYKETGKAYFKVKLLGSEPHYFIPVKLTKITKTIKVVEIIYREEL